MPPSPVFGNGSCSDPTGDFRCVRHGLGISEGVDDAPPFRREVGQWPFRLQGKLVAVDVGLDEPPDDHAADGPRQDIRREAEQAPLPDVDHDVDAASKGREGFGYPLLAIAVRAVPRPGLQQLRSRVRSDTACRRTALRIDRTRFVRMRHPAPPLYAAAEGGVGAVLRHGKRRTRAAASQREDGGKRNPINFECERGERDDEPPFAFFEGNGNEVAKEGWSRAGRAIHRLRRLRLKQHSSSPRRKHMTKPFP